MRLSAKHEPIYIFMINGFISFIVNIPGGTVVVGVTILLLKDGLMMDDVLAGVVLLVRDDRVLTLVSTQKIVI